VNKLAIPDTDSREELARFWGTRDLAEIKDREGQAQPWATYDKDNGMETLEFPKTFPKLETDRLLLRAITPEDRAGLFKNFSDKEVASWFFDEPYSRIEQADEIIQALIDEFEQGTGLTWAITLKGSNEFVGTCGYEEVEVGSWGEIGFDLAKEHWGKGLMSEALSAIIEVGFHMLRLDKIEAHTYATNARAIRLLRNLGFRMEDVGDDSHCYSLLEKDRRNPERA
jgi:ribosomal-protein-alanine N-acetyltransferase